MPDINNVRVVTPGGRIFYISEEPIEEVDVQMANTIETIKIISVGDGTPILKGQITTDTYALKSIVAGNNINITMDNDTITIASSTSDIDNLSELVDVNISNLQNNQFLTYDADQDKWKNITLSYSNITGTPPVSPASIATCTDVKLTDLQDQQILQYNATDSKWENNYLPLGFKWSAQTGIKASGSSSSDALELDDTKNIFIINDASIVMNNAITSFTILDNAFIVMYLQNIGTTYLGPYQNGIANIPLTGGSGKDAFASVQIERSASIYSGTINFTANNSTTYCIGGTPFTTGTTQNGDPIGSIKNVFQYITKDNTTYLTSTSIIINDPTPLNKGYIPYKAGDVVPVYYYVLNATAGTYQQCGTITINSFKFFDSPYSSSLIAPISGVTLTNKGSEYQIGDKLPIILSGQPTSLDYPTLNVTNVQITPPAGVIIPDKNDGEMIIVINDSSTQFNVYPASGKINGNLSYLIDIDNYDTKFVRSDTDWLAF